MYLLQKNVFEILKKEKEDIARLFHKLIQENKLYANLSEEKWIDINYPWHIMDANRIIMEWDHSIIPASIKENVNLNGVVRFGENFRLYYTNIGDKIGNNCLIRDYTSIANNCLIGFGTEIKTSILFSNILLGRLSFIGDL